MHAVRAVVAAAVVVVVAAVAVAAAALDGIPACMGRSVAIFSHKVRSLAHT